MSIPTSTADGQADFLVHSMHCYFVLAGDPDIPVLYHVERVREGRNFMTRTVQARQRGKCIFTTTMSFVREGSAGKDMVEHEMAFPNGVEEGLDEAGVDKDGEPDEAMGVQASGPFESRIISTLNGELNDLCLLERLTTFCYRRFSSSRTPTYPPMDPRSRRHLVLWWRSGPPLSHLVHVRQLLHRHCRTRA